MKIRDFLTEGFVGEGGVLPGIASVDIDREDLPQIDSDPESREEFFEYLRTNNVHIIDSMMEIKHLKPIQGEYDMAKVDSMIESDFRPETDPILVSGDGYILDGHHRWVAAWNLGLEEMAAQMFGASLNEALELMRNYPKVKFKKVDDRVVQEYGVPDDSTMPAYGMKKVKRKGRAQYVLKADAAGADYDGIYG